MIICSEKIYVVSENLRDYYHKTYHRASFVEKYTTAKQKIVVPDIISRKYHLKKNSYILYVGRFVPEKRVEWLIQAYQEIAPSGVTLILAGGSSHADDYEDMLHSIANNKNILFTGYIFGKEKAELISNCLIFVLPSITEGYPIAVVEAQSYGKTSLAGDFLREEFPKQNTMHYFKRDDFGNFKEKLTRLIAKHP